MNYYDLAIYHYKNAININEKFVPALEALAKLYISGEGREKIDIDKILQLLESIEGEEAFVSKARGMLLFEQSPQNALNCFEDSKIANPTNEYIYNNIGCCFESIGDYDNAIKNYQRAISINSQYYQAYNNLAIICIKTRNLDMAKNSITECLNIKPDYAYGLETKGLILEEDSKYTEAISYYLKALSYKIWEGPFSNIGRIYEYEFELPELSKVYYEQAYNLNSKSVSTNYNLGNYYRKYTDNFLLATKFLTEAYNIDPNNALCSLSLGILYWSLKDYCKARDYFAFSYLCDKSSLGCFWLCCALLEDKQYENVELLLDKFRKNQKNLLIDFLYIYFLKNWKEESYDCDGIILLWRDEKIYKKYLKNIGYGKNLLLMLQGISNIYLSLSKDRIYKDSKLHPIINLKYSYQFIKDNFYELIKNG